LFTQPDVRRLRDCPAKTLITRLRRFAWPHHWLPAYVGRMLHAAAAASAVMAHSGSSLVGFDHSRQTTGNHLRQLARE